MGNSNSTPMPATATNTTTSISNMASDLKPAGEGAAKVKPCCVCKDEKSQRDECMLFSKADDPQQDCRSLVDKYRACMKGYGFEIQ